jgi:hypothetical protein
MTGDNNQGTDRNDVASQSLPRRLFLRSPDELWLGLGTATIAKQLSQNTNEAMRESGR